MGRLFGTDGVRGLANRDLSAELALELAVSAARVLGERGDFTGRRPIAVVGRDSRASGEFLEAAVVAGLASAGVDVARLGVVPTPAVAHLTGELDAGLGVVLSASHNPMPDNGVKFFSRGGRKLPDEVEDAVEAGLLGEWQRPVGAGVGRVRDVEDAVGRYVDHLCSTGVSSLAGLRVVVDCANGAASVSTPLALRRAGADVVAIGCDPDGLNINDECGSTHIAALVEAVLTEGADAGIAHDGDADRCLAVAADGSVVDGDQILAILALAARNAGTLLDDTVVTTVMANLGFKLAMREAGVHVVEAAVGDRYVLEAMRAGGYNLGGEQSGHVVMLDHATTGDGALTALHLLGQVAVTGRPLAELASVVRRMPQVLINVDGVDKSRVEECAPVQEALLGVQAELGEAGRVLLRPSGTEPVVRVMVEAATADQARMAADLLAGVVRKHLGC